MSPPVAIEKRGNAMLIRMVLVLSLIGFVSSLTSGDASAGVTCFNGTVAARDYAEFEQDFPSQSPHVLVTLTTDYDHVGLSVTDDTGTKLCETITDGESVSCAIATSANLTIAVRVDNVTNFVASGFRVCSSE